MTEFNADSMHRLAKMALDAGDVASPEEALALFSRYRLRIHLGHGWANTLAGQACFLTALNTAVRAFLGGVEVYGDLSFKLDVPLYQGRSAFGVAEELGAAVVTNAATELPTLVLGIPSDRLFTLDGQDIIAAHSPGSLDGELATRLDSPFGHDAFLIEFGRVGEELTRLLAI